MAVPRPAVTDPVPPRGPAAGPRGLAGLRALLPWRAVVAPWLVSRTIAVTVLLLAVNQPEQGSRFSQLVSKWDGAFYLAIAREGYGPVDVDFPRWPFFPGLPSIIRVLGELGDDRVLIFVVEQLAFLVALAGLHRLAARHGGPRVAMWSVWALALFPASCVFSMTYPSSLFLAASVWAFVLVEEDHVVLAGLVAAVGAAVRPNGIVIAIALLLAVRGMARWAAILVPSVAVIVVWCAYCYDATGDAFVFLTTKSRWQEISFVGLFTGDAKWSVLPHLVLAVAAIGALVWQRRSLPWPWLVFAALALVPALISGMVGLARYTNECFPPFVAAGQILDRWSTGARIGALCASGAGMVVFAFVVGRYELVP